MKISIYCAVIGLLFLGIYPNSTYAFTYGNPTRTLEPGAFYAGLAVSEMERKFDATLSLSTTTASASATAEEKIDISETIIVLGFGVSEDVLIEVSFGNVSLTDSGGGEIDGNEFGGLFLRKGLLISLRQGDVDNSNWVGDFSQMDVGYGISKEAGENSSMYGIVLFSKASSSLTATSSSLSEGSAVLGVTLTSATLEFEEESAIGVVGGFEYQPSEDIALSFEIHGLFETGFGLRFTAGF